LDAAVVLVPQALHGLRPSGDLLNLVDHEQGRTGVSPAPRQGPPDFPLLREPGPVLKRELVGRNVVDGLPQPLADLAGESCLADLARPRQDLDETAILTQPAVQQRIEMPMKDAPGNF
jgi:hypothetical protein